MSPRPSMAKLDADNPFSRRSIGKITANEQDINSVIHAVQMNMYSVYEFSLQISIHFFNISWGSYKMLILSSHNLHTSFGLVMGKILHIVVVFRVYVPNANYISDLRLS